MSQPKTSEGIPTPRVWKTKWFARFARQNLISDVQLCEAVKRAESGIVDADLGAGIIKQRLARRGAGRSGGFRLILFFKSAHRTFFVFGFAKKDRESLTEHELKGFKAIVGATLELSEIQIDELVGKGELIEVICNEEDLQE